MASFTGTPGDDSIAGTNLDDDFHMEDGGDDTVSGGDGFDVFYFGAGFTAADHIIGGARRDVLVLDGDYSAGVSFVSGGVTGVEQLRLVGGHDYALDGVGIPPEIDASGLGPGDRLTVDAIFSGRIHVIGGAGADLVTGSTQADTLEGGAGDDTLVGADGDDQLYAGGGRDRLAGGLGANYFHFDGDLDKTDRVFGGGFGELDLTGGAHLALAPNTITDIDLVRVAGGAYDLTLNDHNLAAGATMIVRVEAGATLRFDGSREADGRFDIIGGTGSDTLVGGAGDDSIRGGGGGDTLVGGTGDDVLVGDTGGAARFVGGLGADTLRGSLAADDRYDFNTVADSSAAGPDRIVNLNDGDIVRLKPIDADTTTAGDQAFHLVATLTGHTGELALSYDAVRDQTTVSGDVDGDGTADLVILIAGDQTAFTGFQL